MQHDDLAGEPEDDLHGVEEIASNVQAQSRLHRVWIVVLVQRCAWCLHRKDDHIVAGRKKERDVVESKQPYIAEYAFELFVETVEPPESNSE